MKVLGICSERSLTLPPLSSTESTDDSPQASNALLNAPSRHLMAINHRRQAEWMAFICLSRSHSGSVTGDLFCISVAAVIKPFVAEELIDVYNINY